MTHSDDFSCPESTKTEQRVFVVTTYESVEGTYRVLATSADEARRKFRYERGRHHLIDWEGVEQMNYMAYDVEVHDVKEARGDD